MLHFLLIGALLGLAAGFSPGPLLALVVAETLNHGFRAGLRTALSPLVTDLPIVLISLLLIKPLQASDLLLGGISLFGGCFLLFLGVQCFKTGDLPAVERGLHSRSLLKGVLTNALSPHPYLFWIGVGAPLVTSAADSSYSGAGLLIGGFYLCLVGSKILIALLVERGRSFLGGRLYRLIMLALGALIILLALLMYHRGLQLLEVLP